jgi:hypothetical protein
VWLAPAAVRADVHDNAHLFGQQAIDDANTVTDRMDKQYKKQLVIETFPSVPDAQKDELKQKGNAKFFRDWMAARAKDLKVNGVYVLICREPYYVETGAGHETRARHIFTTEYLTKLREQLQRDLNAHDCDEALCDAVDLVYRAYAANIPGAKPLGEG